MTPTLTTQESHHLQQALHHLAHLYQSLHTNDRRLADYAIEAYSKLLHIVYTLPAATQGGSTELAEVPSASPDTNTPQRRQLDE